MGAENETTALALPDRDTFVSTIKTVNEFQQLVHQHLIEGADWGIIPGTTKPTLLKPGAEKIAKLLGLSDQYEIIDRQEDWSKPFFRYLIRCKLIHVASQSLITEGLGECNSMESKYRWRWISERDLPQEIDKTKLVTQERTAKTGGHWTVFRFENDDIYSQVNTILKMAKKRALVDAALSAGRLSNVFTQDMEDLPAEEMAGETKVAQPKEHWCPIHNVAFFKKGKMKWYAHTIESTDEWCNEEREKDETIKDDTESPNIAETKQEEPISGQDSGEAAKSQYDFDADWLTESLKQVKWKDATAKSWCRNVYKIDSAGKPLDTNLALIDLIASLSRENREAFFREINNRLPMI